MTIRKCTVAKALRVLMVTAEAAPYAKVGGLGDVLQALPQALVERGHDVRVCLPLYRSIRPQGHWTSMDNVPVRVGNQFLLCRVWEAREVNRSTFYFVDHDNYFSRDRVYCSNGEDVDSFIFLTRASLGLCESIGWCPDVFHGHDWPTGLLPVYLNTLDRNGPLGSAATVFTIHNLEHQGVFGTDVFYRTGLPLSEFRSDGLEALGCINFMKGALYHATKVTTVSPTYAREIQTPPFGMGLHDVLHLKTSDLIGILNGIDTVAWNPATDTALPKNFDIDDLSGKRSCKRALQALFRLNPAPDIPVYGVVCRFCAQKGLDILADIVPDLLSSMRLQIVVLGTGDKRLEDAYCHLQSRFPGQLGVRVGYSEDWAHKIEAGCDFFLMPSRFEPCGLNQMYSMRYGTPPIVRCTGGLADTVDNYRPGTGLGTGFVFHDLTPTALFNTVGWSCATYYDHPLDYRQLQHNAMRRNFGWSSSAKIYERVYRWAVSARRRGKM